MKLTTSKLVDGATLCAVIAGLLFIGIQVVHPPDVIASVTTSAWVLVHTVSIAMSTLFVIGLVGIYLRQVEKAGWLGLAALIVMILGLLLTAGLTVVEAYVIPQLATSNPEYVEGFLGLVEGHASTADLGAIPTLWAIHDALFMLGTISFGLVTLWAGVLPRLAAALFTFGLFLFLPVVTAFDSPRLAAIPIGLSLAWLGYAAWSKGRQSFRSPAFEPATAQDQTAGA